MRDAYGISAAEAIAVDFAELAWKLGIAVFITILDVGAAVILKVLARALNAIVKTAALGFIEFPWRHVPVTVAILAETWGW
jgi:hypothetical protein